MNTDKRVERLIALREERRRHEPDLPSLTIESALAYIAHAANQPSFNGMVSSHGNNEEFDEIMWQSLSHKA